MAYPRYDVYNPRIYGPETKHDVNVVTFIARHHLVLQRIVAEGGGKLLCQLWDNEVAECRRSIRQVESYQNAAVPTGPYIPLNPYEGTPLGRNVL